MIKRGVWLLSATMVFLFLATPSPVSAAPSCTPNTVGPITCVEIVSLSTAQPQLNGTLTITVRITGTSFPASPPTAIQLRVYADVFGTDPELGTPTTVNVTGDSSGNVNQNVPITIQVVSPLVVGENQIYIESTTTVGGMSVNTIAYTSRVTIDVTSSAQASASLAIQATVGAGPGGVGQDPTGLNWNFSSSYIPAGQTQPSTSGITISWNFGDGTTGSGFSTTHRYGAPGGTFTIFARALNAAGTVLATSNTITIDTRTGGQQNGTLGEVNAQPSGGPLQALLITILGFISGVIRQILYWLYALIILPFITGAMTIDVASGQCTTGSSIGSGFLGIVCGGWGYVRNMVNMIFILIMIVIGLATILRLESYNYKKLLGKLLIYALLVNFSLVIAQAILALADVLQHTFVGTATDINTFKDMGKQLINRSQFQNDIGFLDLLIGNSRRGTIDILVSQIIELMIAFCAFITFAAIAVFLMIRLVALWFLLILSPFAYAFMILPATKSMAMSWWSHFLKYAFFAPIMFFFIRVAIAIQSQTTNLFGKNACQFATSSTNINCTAAANSMAAFIFNNTQQLTVLLFLFAGLFVAKKLSVFGAAAAMNYAQKAALLPAVAVAGGAKLGAQYVNRKKTDFTRKLPTEAGGAKGRAAAAAYALLNPVSTFKGLQQRREGLRKTTYETAEAKGRDIVNRVFTRGAVMATEQDRVETQHMNNIGKEYAHMTKEQKSEQMGKLMGKRGREYEDRRNALAIVAAEGGHIDDIIGSKYFMVDKNGKKYGEAGFDENNLSHSKYATPEEVAAGQGVYSRAIIGQFLNEALGNTRQANRTRFMMEEIGKSNHHEEYGGHGTYENGEYQALTGTEGENRAINEKLKTDERAGRKGAPHEYATLRLAPLPVIEDGKLKDVNGNDWSSGSAAPIALQAPTMRSGGMDRFNETVYEANFRNARIDNVTEHAQGRTPKLLLGGTSTFSNVADDGYLVGDKVDFGRVQTMAKQTTNAFRGFFKGIGGKTLGGGPKGEDPAPRGFRMYDEGGKITEYDWNDDDRQFVPKGTSKWEPPEARKPKSTSGSGGGTAGASTTWTSGTIGGNAAPPPRSTPPPTSGGGGTRGGTGAGGAPPATAAPAATQAGPSSQGGGGGEGQPASSGGGSKYEKSARDSAKWTQFVNNPTGGYREDIGAAAAVEALRGIHRDNKVLAQNIEKLVKSYQGHVAASQSVSPAQSMDVHQNLAVRQTMQGLSQQERDALSQFLAANGQKMGMRGVGQAELQKVMKDFLNHVASERD